MARTARRTPLALVLITAMLVTQAGCYDWVAIQPQEIGKLRAGSSQVVGQTGNATIVAVSTQTVTAENGTATQINGEYDLRITSTDQKTTTFSHPLVVEPMPPNGYLVQGGNQPRTPIDLSSVKRAEVSQYSQGKTILAVTAVNIVAAAILLGVLLK